MRKRHELTEVTNTIGAVKTGVVAYVSEAAGGTDRYQLRLESWPLVDGNAGVYNSDKIYINAFVATGAVQPDPYVMTLTADTIKSGGRS